jgi:hypothetical protein
MEALVTEADLYLRLAIAVLVMATTIVSTVTAFLVRRGIVNKTTADEALEEKERAKKIAFIVANALDRVKEIDSNIGRVATNVVTSMVDPEEKKVLDEFLKNHNLNQKPKDSQSV